MSDIRPWHKSSYSGGSGASCVEVAEGPQAVGVRDTQNRPLGHIDYTPRAWAAFLHDLKDDRL